MMKVEEYQILMKSIRPKLLKKAVQSVNNEDDAEDLVQEVLLKLWMAQTQWENYNNIDAVAITTLKNCIIDRYRLKKQITESLDNLQMKSVEPTPYQKVEAKENVNILLDIIQKLPELQRLIISMKDVEGYDIEDIVKITNSSIDSIRMNLSRARKRVKAMYLVQIEK